MEECQPEWMDKIELDIVDEIKAAHINIRSYQSNRSALEKVILSREFDIIAVTETWHAKKIKIPTGEYETYTNPADGNKGSGLALIIRKKIMVH